MHNFTKMLGASFVCMLFVSNGYAATAATARTVSGNQAVRMPSIPATTVNVIGNMAVDVNEGATTTPDIKPDVKPDVNPKPECADGGVRNSEYSVADCMNDILSCINNGALSGGLNDLFNEDVRNAIVNGMGLCSGHVDKCITSVRRDCNPVYRATADVWVDFNSRKVQPEYYNFVLRKTGLTPNQAENTCMLLDKNTYGPSFSAVANDGKTTAEYNQNVGAYNGQMGNVLIKSNPMGAKVNDGNPGVDGARGHYARWDATTATCYIRVAAYNKDQQIKNSWLFGALGDDQLAEVWRPAGDTFSCNKDLFGFSLLNDTSTAAVVGVGGGTLLGAGIGAIAGHGKRVFDCNNEKHRVLLMEQLQSDGTINTINYYLNKPVSRGAKSVNLETCQEIVDLYDKMLRVDDALNACDSKVIGEDLIMSDGSVNCEGYDDLESCFKSLEIAKPCVGRGFTTVKQCAEYLSEQDALQAESEADNMFGSGGNGSCHFKPLRKSTVDDILCNGISADCVGPDQIERDVNELSRVFGKETKEKGSNTSLAYLILNGERSNMLGSIATGAAIGAGAGGVATAITAFVEKNNISCRVGDGLSSVSFGKSHSIDTLKDFYVKWNLRLPDTVSPTSMAVDCDSWKSACAQYTDLNQCKAVALNYKPDAKGAITLVRSACSVSGSACIANDVVAKSYGACK